MPTTKITTNSLADSAVTSEKLASSISIDNLSVSGNLTVDTNTLFVDSANNRVGIGTTTPAAGYALDVVGAAKIGGNILCGGSILYLNSQQSLTQGTNSLTLGAATYFTTINYGNASTTIHNFVSGNVGIGTATPSGAKLVIKNDNDSSKWLLQTQNDNGNTNSLLTQTGEGDFVWYGYRNGTTLGSPELALHTNGNSFFKGGNVGIGTATPAAKFEVWTTYIGPTIPALGASNIGFSFLEVAGKYGLIGGVLSNGNCYLQAQRVDATATAYNLLLQSNGGNVGIGTTAATEKLTVAGNISVTGNISATGHFSAATKSFKIPHQSKGGHLQYGVVESDCHSVLVRGKISSDTITLPEHWSWLVDADSVTVQLTPVGCYQQLYIVSSDNQTVKVGGVTGEYCYVVYGTRKDVAPLEVEIE